MCRGGESGSGQRDVRCEIAKEGQHAGNTLRHRSGLLASCGRDMAYRERSLYACAALAFHGRHVGSLRQRLQRWRPPAHQREAPRVPNRESPVQLIQRHVPCRGSLLGIGHARGSAGRYEIDPAEHTQRSCVAADTFFGNMHARRPVLVTAAYGFWRRILGQRPNVPKFGLPGGTPTNVGCSDTSRECTRRSTSGAWALSIPGNPDQGPGTGTLKRKASLTSVQLVVLVWANRKAT